MSKLHPIFYPDSVAIIGASKDQTKRGYKAVEKLVLDRFGGAIYPINPKESHILGIPAYRTINDVPGEVDLAVICTPAKTLPSVIRDCAAKKVKGAVVLAGGFAESGEEGAALQQAMVEAAAWGGVRIIGPNTSGLMNTHAACNIVGFSDVKRGGIGLMSQSGNMALTLVTEAQANSHVGISTYVGIGNEADIRVDEYLDFFKEDINTDVVIAYLEGVKDGRRFLDALRTISEKKPVVVYKSGRTSAGQSAAQSHTGALAGDYVVSEGVLSQAGAILARQSDDILVLAETLSLQKPLASRRVAVLADGGGHATIAADVLSGHGMELAKLSSKTKERLAAILPSGAAVANPVDVAGATDANPSVFATCAAILLEDPSVDALLVTGLYGGYCVRFSATLAASELETSEAIARLQARSNKPVLIHSLYANLAPANWPIPLSSVREAGLPVYASLEKAVRGLEALAKRGEYLRTTKDTSTRIPASSPRFAETLARCGVQRRDVVLEHEARDALAEVGAKLAPAILAKSAAEAADAFRKLGNSPVAVKIVSKDVIHKSEAGGVRLNISSEEEAKSAFNEIVDNALAYSPSAEITGVLVTPMAPKGGIEVIIGVVKDPSYGPVLMFGLGGILVEVIKDVTFRSLPLTEQDAQSMIDELRTSAIFNGVRGALPTDKNALVELMMVVSGLCTAYPQIAELDLNPVIAYHDGVGILDARILLDAPKEPESSC